MFKPGDIVLIVLIGLLIGGLVALSRAKRRG
jgi:hypothetical protein